MMQKIAEGADRIVFAPPEEDGDEEEEEEEEEEEVRSRSGIIIY